MPKPPARRKAAPTGVKTRSLGAEPNGALRLVRCSIRIWQQGVEVQEISVDTRDPDRRYLPGHPDAGPDGYVAFPRINPAEDMVDLTSAARGFEANVSAISAVKDMIMRSIDLFK